LSGRRARQDRPVSSRSPPVEGVVHAGFEPVLEAFAELAADEGEGCAVALYLDGKLRVDLWGGTAWPRRPWQRDTLVQTFSVVKGVAALVILLLDERGELEVEAPVAQYWPEFAAAGKDHAPVSSILTHTLGLPWVEGYSGLLTLDDGAAWAQTDEVLRRLAEAAPVWRPGSRFGYHSITGGLLLGEVVRRATGRSLGSWFRAEVAEPLALDYWIGLPAAHHERAAVLLADPELDSDELAALVHPGSPVGRALFIGRRRRVGTAFERTYADPAFVQAELPSTSGIGDARSLGRLYAVLAAGGTLDGIRLCSPDSIARFTEERVCGRDAVWPVEFRIAYGFLRPHEPFAFSPTDTAFGHPGLGGSIAFADPEHDLAFAFVTRRLDAHFELDPRAARLIAASYAAL
jgi:CubicO group peptidase (beta-lactamase class C family)